MSLHLLNSKVLQENDINIIVSLYMNKQKDGKVYFSYYTDYLGYGLTEDECHQMQDDILSQKFKSIIGNDMNITNPEKLTKDECLKKIELFVSNMDNLTFEDVARLFVNN